MNVFVPASSSTSSALEAAFTLSADESQSVFAGVHSRGASINTAVAMTSIAVISQNKFFRTCLTRCLVQMTSEFEIHSYGNIQEWMENDGPDAAKIVLLCATGQKETDTVVQQDLDTVLQAASDARVIVVSDVDHPAPMIGALEKGARGFVPMSLDLEVAFGAIKLVNVGGTFIPASGLMSMRSTSAANAEQNEAAATKSYFTGRQREVLEHLRVGDPNKIIAHKMSMSEATVKIHVRNMMRKIKAKNRTELVCKSNALFNWQ
jgi:DNA-binding NarL/FixJ family response regulator